MTDEAAVVVRENNVITRQESTLFSPTNKVFISGRIGEELKYSHSVLWEEFYETKVVVKRLSGVEDNIPLIVSSFLIGKYSEHYLEGKWVEVAGTFRLHNYIGKDGRTHLSIFVFASAINIYDNECDLEEANSNLIFLEGYICKPTTFRITPKTTREISDFLMAVNRTYMKSDYIPCISWGRVAKAVAKLQVGDKIRIYGRIQSRTYFKRFSIDSEKGEYREVYEISTMRVQTVEELLIGEKSGTVE